MEVKNSFILMICEYSINYLAYMMYGSHLAAQGGHVEILETILKNDIDISLRTEAGNTCLHIGTYFSL